MAQDSLNMEKKRILLFGATGMAGHMVYHYLKDTGRYEMYNTVFRTKLTADSLVVDVRERKAVEAAVRQTQPDIILNCVGALVRESHEQPANAVLLNAWFPHALKQLADEAGAKLIHISTDCVFSGRKGHYTESDFRDADDVYGRSKALGEIVDDKDLTLRTSIIGPELKRNGEGLFHWFMSQTGQVQGYKTAIWGGVTTLELAKAIDAAIRQNLCGLVQLSNGEGISKHDLLCLCKQVWERDDIEILPVNANGVDKSIAHSVRFNYAVPSYEEMLLEQRAWMETHPSLYEQYRKRTRHHE